jgi:hypothetical protein
MRFRSMGFSFVTALADYYFLFCGHRLRTTMATTMKKHLSEKAQMHGLKELVAHVANESRIQVGDEERYVSEMFWPLCGTNPNTSPQYEFRGLV